LNFKLNKKDSFFSPAEEKRIISAIKKAEKNTSGEIRVHIDETLGSNPLDRAKKAFRQMEMHKTRDRNGVLFYISTRDNGFAIWGDVGINKITPDGFWDEIKDIVIDLFSKNKRIEGILKGIKMAGDSLKEYFPYIDDVNELNNEISRKKI